MIVYRELATIERELGFHARTLYGVSRSLPQHYRKVPLSKRDGTIRCLSVPDEILKSIQRAIGEKLLAYMPISVYATAYYPGSSTLKNAQLHCGQERLLKLDIHDFFGSVLYSTVKKTVFPAEVFSEQIRTLLTNLCYYQDALPQGAPTSPAIANILLREFDLRIGAYCKSCGISYTRYCDDMTFSGAFDSGKLRHFVSRELRAEGFVLNEKKTHTASRAQRQCVTGVVVNDKPSVPRAYRRHLRQELFYMRKYGVESHLQQCGGYVLPETYLQSMLGRVNYVLSIAPDSSEFLNHRNWLLSELKRRIAEA